MPCSAALWGVAGALRTPRRAPEASEHIKDAVMTWKYFVFTQFCSLFLEFNGIQKTNTMQDARTDHNVCEENFCVVEKGIHHQQMYVQIQGHLRHWF